MLLLISPHHSKRTICVTHWWHEQTALYPIINWSRAVAWFNIKPNNNVWKFSLAHFNTQDSGFSKDSCTKGFLNIFSFKQTWFKIFLSVNQGILYCTEIKYTSIKSCLDKCSGAFTWNSVFPFIYSQCPVEWNKTPFPLCTYATTNA